jgi:HemY protein
MVRVLFYVILLFAIAAGFAWLAERPGALTLSWQGYEIETSLMVGAIAIVAIVAAITLLGAIIRAVVATPRAIGNYLGARRRDRGYRALSRGMIAVGAGDIKLARHAADESSILLGDEPLTLLLTAQAAQLAGDGAGARTAFEALATRPETRVLGLHGLFIEARRQGEEEAAQHFAEEANQAAPKIGWAGTALFEYQARTGDWLGALRTLAANTKAKIVDREASQRLRAVLLTARAMEIEGNEPGEAQAAALEAHRLAPELTEAAIVAGRLLARAGDTKRAARVLEAAWKVQPHPEIADAYAAVRSGDSVSDRLKRMRRLADIRAHHPEGVMALARAAIDAREWGAAREALEGLLRSQPSERVCLLMAEIEEGEHGDEGRVRSWLGRAIHAPRDPVWVADGQVFPRWAPTSPITGRIDAFEWKVVSEPVSQAWSPEAITERHAEAPPRIPLVESMEKGAAGPAQADKAVLQTPVTTPIPAEAAVEEEPEELPAPAPPTVSEPVIPRAPDDPGPEDGDEEPGSRRFRLFRPSA